MYVSVTALQIFHHSFHTTPEFSIYQKHHHNFTMFMATYNQDSLWRFLSNLHWFQWHLVWWIMARQVLTYPTNAKFDMGNVNISKLSIFNLLFSWIEPQLLFESILFRSKSSSSRTSRTLLVLAQGIGVFCKLQSHRLGIKRIGWEKKLVMELDFNLAGDSGKENTDSILAHLDCFHTVKYQKKKNILAHITLNILMHLILIKHPISLVFMLQPLTSWPCASSLNNHCILYIYFLFGYSTKGKFYIKATKI